MNSTIDVPLIGLMNKDNRFNEYCSAPVFINFLNKECTIIFENYEDDEKKEDFHQAVQDFLSLSSKVLSDAEEYVFLYYKDVADQLGFGETVLIENAQEVWKFVTFGSTLYFSRRPKDNLIYVSLECECEWEEEHGLQIVFKEAKRINKVGEFDGHLTNSSAYGDDKLEDVIYK